MSFATITVSLASATLGAALGRGLETLDASLWDGGEDLDADLPTRQDAFAHVA